jgi:hypothetical protein
LPLRGYTGAMAPETILRGLAAILALPILSSMMSAQGLPAEWEVREWANRLGRQMEALSPQIERFQTASWTGAAAAYTEQRTMASKEAGYAAAAARQLAERPTGLGKAFELHLRVQAVEGLVTSLAAASRDYQQDGVAESTLNMMAEARDPHSQLRDYIVDLAASKEQELAAIDEEAQRCRALMLRAPAATPAKPARTPATPKPSPKKN